MSLRLSHVIAYCALLALGCQTVLAQQTPASDEDIGRNLRVLILTIGTGDPVYERFGHNAIVVEQAAASTSQDASGLAFNYGMFEFDEQFLPHFIDGNMQYWAQAYRLDEMVDYYRGAEHRSMWMQELNLTAGQRGALVRILESQARPFRKNWYYTYNYYDSNCSTKVRDALDQVMGGALKEQLAARASGTTYRWHTRRVMAYSIPLYTSLEFVLGHWVDRGLSAWEESFLPVELQRHLRTVVVADPSGRKVPLVSREWTVYEAPRPPDPAGPPRWLLGYLTAGAAMGLGLVGLSRVNKGWGRHGFVALGVCWSLLAGAAGMFLSYAFTTGHWAVYWNENILQLSPAALPLAILIPMSIVGRRQTVRKLGMVLGAVAVMAVVGLAVPISSPAVRSLMVPMLVGGVLLGGSLMVRERWLRGTALSLAGLVLLVSLVGLAAKALPWFYQVNQEIIALSLPPNAGLALGMWRILGRKADIIAGPRQTKGN